MIKITDSELELLRLWAVLDSCADGLICLADSLEDDGELEEITPRLREIGERLIDLSEKYY